MGVKTVYEGPGTGKVLSGELDDFELLYKQYFKPLFAYAYTLLQDESDAEEIIQNLFLKLWEKREHLDVHTSVRAYLYKAVYFDCLNLIKHRKVKASYQRHLQHTLTAGTQNMDDSRKHAQLESRLRQALNELPEQCRTVFQLSRFESLRYRDIASRLGISEKTVENHMGKALKLLRSKLADVMLGLLCVLIYLKTRSH